MLFMHQLQIPRDAQDDEDEEKRGLIGSLGKFVKAAITSDDAIQVKFYNLQDRRIQEVSAKRDTTVKALLNDYSTQYDMPLKSFRFYLNGKVLFATDSLTMLHELKMKHNDMISVKDIKNDEEVDDEAKAEQWKTSIYSYVVGAEELRMLLRPTEEETLQREKIERQKEIEKYHEEKSSK